MRRLLAPLASVVGVAALLVLLGSGVWLLAEWDPPYEHHILHLLPYVYAAVFTILFAFWVARVREARATDLPPLVPRHDPAWPFCVFPAVTLLLLSFTLPGMGRVIVRLPEVVALTIGYVPIFSAALAGFCLASMLLSQRKELSRRGQIAVAVANLTAVAAVVVYFATADL